MTDIKMKNTNAEGKSLRIQSWNGALPTFDNEQQRGLARAAALGVDASGNPVDAGNPPAVPVEALPKDFAKYKKEELITLANSRKDAGKDITLDEADTVAILREKITATYPEPVEEEEGTETEKAPAEPAQAANAGHAANFTFKPGALLSEITLTPGEEKVIGVTAGMFITIKEDI